MRWSIAILEKIMNINQPRYYEWLKIISISLSFGFSLEGRLSLAQIVPDSTLGNENSVVTSGVDVKGSPASVIEGGANRGQNLFHSFSEFNVNDLQRVYFANPQGIQRIFSRITGQNISSVNGLLGVLGNASLFILNPNGIIFGQNASLDINGSFVATTADRIIFGNEFSFSASNPQNVPPLLAVNVPLGLQYGRNSGKITNLAVTQGIGLQVPTDKTIALIGGDIEINGGIISAFGGRVELGSVGENSFVIINEVSNGYSFNYDNVEQFKDINLSSAFVNVNGARGGDLQAVARNIVIKESSVINAGTFAELSGGTLFFKSSNLFELKDNSSIVSSVRPQAIGNGNDIFIEAESLVIDNNSVIFSDTNGIGDGGNVEISAKKVQLIGSSNGILTPTFGIGDAGNITVNTDILKLTDGSQIATNTRGQGNAGKLTINAIDIELMGFGFITPENARPSGILAQVLPNATGEAGNIIITTKTLKLRDTATTSNDTFGIGNAGDLTIVAEEIEMTGSTTENGFSTAIASASNRGATGNAGNINIETNSLLILDGAGVSALSFGDGKSGNINISANEIKLVGISDDGEVPSALTTQVTSSIGSDNESNLIVKTNRLKIADGGQISASTFGDGQAGDIKIKASEIEVIGATPDGKNSSGIRSQVNPSSIGNAGNIEISSQSLKIIDGGKISVSTFGEGRGGNLTIDATKIEILGTNINNNSSSGLFSESVGTGDGGKLIVNTEQLSILDGARISASSQDIGLAGNLEINTDSLKLDDSAITTQTDVGDGGNISLNVGNLLLRNNSQISTTAGKIEAGGDGGDININSDFIVAVPRENSDITANAFNGRGGNINITTKGIFGIEFRSQQTPLSDITASSEFGIDGEVSINILNLNPESSFVSLPRSFSLPPLDTSCQINNGENASSFVNKGKGGLPENPSEIRSEPEIWDDLRSPLPDNNSPNPEYNPQSREYQPIIEAQRMVIGDNGKIILVANIEQKNNLENYHSPKLTNSCGE